MEITIPATIIWITAILIISLDIVILIGSKNISSLTFAFLSFITALWVISQGFLVSTTSYKTAEDLIRYQYVLGIAIAFGFYHFSYIFPNERLPSLKSIIISSIFLTIFTYLYLFTNIFITHTQYIGGYGKWAWMFGKFHWVFEITFCTLWSIALIQLYKSYKSLYGFKSINIRNMFWALLLGIIPPNICKYYPTFVWILFFKLDRSNK